MGKKPMLIKKLGLEERVIELHTKQGYGAREIARQLSKEYGIQISHMAVQRFLMSHRNRVINAMSQSADDRNELAEYGKKVFKQVQKLNKEMWKLFNELKNQEYSETKIVAVANQILKQLEFISKLIGSVTQKPVTNIVENKTQIINITTDINVTIKRLEEMGYIIGTEDDVVKELKRRGYKVKKKIEISK